MTTPGVRTPLLGHGEAGGSSASDRGRDWAAPAAPVGVAGVVAVPGSKSLTNRALVLAALADGPSVLRAPLVARDTVLMADGLGALGAGVQRRESHWQVSPPESPAGRARFRGDTAVHAGLAGTVMRFLPLLAAFADGPVTFDGDTRARDRPMAATVDSLRALGVQVRDGGRARLPFTVLPTGRVGVSEVEVDASASSQFLSALLLIAPACSNGLTIRHIGPPLPSRDHVAMTVSALRERGVTVDDTAPDRWQVRPGPIRALEVTIEPDLSTAAPFLAAPVLAGGSITVPDWPARTTQPGAALLELLTRMGAEVRRSPDAVTVTAGQPIRALDLDLADTPELVPVITALLAFADGPSTITGVAHVRGQESDRLAALATEINALGGDITELPDGLLIRPRRLTADPGRPFASYADHRIAHAGALLGLVVPGLRVADIATTGKTFPGFAERWSELPVAAA